MACVFSAGWVRSIGYLEQLYSWTKGHSHAQISTWGYLIWISDFPSDPSTRTVPRWLSSPLQSKDIKAYIPGAGVTWRESTLGIGEFDLIGSSGIYKRYTIVVPYWSIGIPLTLLSAWLLLSKPRWKPAKPLRPSVDSPHP